MIEIESVIVNGVRMAGRRVMHLGRAMVERGRRAREQGSPWRRVDEEVLIDLCRVHRLLRDEMGRRGR